MSFWLKKSLNGCQRVAGQSNLRTVTQNKLRVNPKKYEVRCIHVQYPKDRHFGYKKL